MIGTAAKILRSFFNSRYLWPKIVTPFTDAMRFVDCDLRDVPIQRALEKSIEHQPLWRDVKQAIFATIQSPQRSTASCRAKPNSETSPQSARLRASLGPSSAKSAATPQIVNPSRSNAGQLKTKRLPPPVGINANTSRPASRVSNDLFLQWSKGVVAEVLLQERRLNPSHCSSRRKRTQSSAAFYGLENVGNRSLRGFAPRLLYRERGR